MFTRFIFALSLVLVLVGCPSGPPPDLQLEHARTMFADARAVYGFYAVGRVPSELPDYWQTGITTCPTVPPQVDSTHVLFVFREPDAHTPDGRGYLAGELFMPTWKVEQGRAAYPGSIVDGHMAVNGWMDPRDRMAVVWANAETPEVVVHELCHYFAFAAGRPDWASVGH